MVKHFTAASANASVTGVRKTYDEYITIVMDLETQPQFISFGRTSELFYVNRQRGLVLGGMHAYLS